MVNQLPGPRSRRNTTATKDKTPPPGFEDAAQADRRAAERDPRDSRRKAKSCSAGAVKHAANRRPRTDAPVVLRLPEEPVARWAPRGTSRSTCSVEARQDGGTKSDPNAAALTSSPTPTTGIATIRGHVPGALADRRRDRVATRAASDGRRRCPASTSRRARLRRPALGGRQAGAWASPAPPAACTT